jgi:hypothetical protein
MQTDTSAVGKRLQAQVSNVVSDALEANAEIARLGLAEYYRARQPN